MKILLKLIVLVVWIALILEVMLRLMVYAGHLPERVPADIFAAHPIGWFLKPGQDVTIASQNGVIRIQTNSAGFRDQEYPQSRNDKHRLLILGDSYTLALETPQESVFHVQLEKRFSGTTEVISMGVSGYELVQDMLVYQKIGAAYHPDLVILMLYVGNNLTGNQRWKHLPYYALENNELVLHNYPYTGAFNLPLVTTQRSTFLMRHSMLAFTLGTIFRRQPHAESDDLGYCDYWTSVNYPNPTVEEWELSEALLMALRDEVEANGSQFLVVIIPTEFQVEADDLNEFLKTCTIPDYALEQTLQEQLIARLETQRIPYLDLLPVFLQNRNTRLYLPDVDIHWSAEGHRVAAEAIYRMSGEKQGKTVK